MNRLPKNKQIQVISALVESCSIRSIERMYDVHRDTISRLMVRTGMNCMTLMDDLMQDIPTGVYLSKKLENLKAATAIHFGHYNFCRIHSSLRVTPAMAAGVTGQLWTMEALLDLGEQRG